MQVEYFKIVLEHINTFKKIGEKKLNDGTHLIGHVPQVAPQAYLHTFFAPLNDNDLLELGHDLKMIIPEVYKDFLKKANGIHFFVDTLTLDGLRRNYKRNSDDVFQPFHLDIPNVKERIKDSKDSYFYIGGYNWDGSLLYVDLETNKVYRCSRSSSKPLNEWASFEKMIVLEVERLVKLFDDTGNEKKPDTPTIPRGRGRE